MRTPRNRAVVAALLLALPVALFWAIAQRASSRPHLLSRSGGATSLTFSPDGRTLASMNGGRAGSGCEVRLWDVSSRNLKRTLLCPPGPTSAVAFAPRGVTAASSNARGDYEVLFGSNGLKPYKDSPRKMLTGTGLVARDARTGKVLRRFGAAAKTNRFYPILALSPDGKKLAAVGAATYVYHVGSGRLLTTLPKSTHQMQTAAFSPDGSLLAVAGYGGVAVFDLHRGRTLWEQRADHAALIAFSPDGRTLANTHVDKTVRLRDARTGKLQRITPMLSNYGTVSTIAFSPDGKMLASGNWSGKTRLWDLQTMREIRSFHGKPGPVRGALAFSPDGRTLATADAREIKLWRLK